MNVPLSSPDLNDHDCAAVLEVMRSQLLSLGPKVPAFERAITDLTGSKYAIAVNSGTSGLHLCVKAAGIGEGDEVITTPFSFVASANCILFERGAPVFADIDPETYNIDPKRVEDAITTRTRAILPVHVFGRPCAMDELNRIAAKHGLVVIEDACEAIGARYRGQAVGTLGQTGVFAFYPNKQVTTGEGGVIVTDDPAIAQQCRSWRNQGRSDGDQWLEHVSLGYNYRLSDIAAALGVSQVDRITEILASRRRVAELYNDALRDIPEVIPPRIEEPGSEISWFVYVLRLVDDFDQEHRDRLLLELRKRGIGCRNYFPPIHLQPLYQSQFRFRRGAFPVTEHVAERTIALPFFTRLPAGDIERVCLALRDAIQSLTVSKAVAGWSWADA